MLQSLLPLPLQRLALTWLNEAELHLASSVGSVSTFMRVLSKDNYMPPWHA